MPAAQKSLLDMTPSEKFDYIMAGGKVPEPPAIDFSKMTPGQKFDYVMGGGAIQDPLNVQAEPAPVQAVDRSEHGNNMALNLNVPEAAKDPLHIGAAAQNAYWNLQESKGNTQAMRAFELEQAKTENTPGEVVALNRSGVAPMTPVEEAVMLRQMAAKDRGDTEQAAGLENSFTKRIDELKDEAKRRWASAKKGRVKYDLPDNKFGAAILETIESSGMTVEAALRSGALWALGGPALGLMGSFINTATEADYEAGEAFMTALKAGKSPEEIQDAVNSVRKKNLALLSLTNPLGDVLLFGLGKPLKALAGKIAGKGLLAKAGRAVVERGVPYVLGAAPEGVEGGSQEAFQQQAAGQPLDWEKIKEAAGSEALASLLYGLAGRGIRGGANVLLGSQEKAEDSDGGKPGEPLRFVMDDSLARRNHIAATVRNRARELRAIPKKQRRRAETSELRFLEEVMKLYSSGDIAAAEEKLNGSFYDTGSKAESSSPAIVTPPHSGWTQALVPIEQPENASPDELIARRNRSAVTVRNRVRELRAIPENKRSQKEKNELHLLERVMKFYNSGYPADAEKILRLNSYNTASTEEDGSSTVITQPPHSGWTQALVPVSEQKGERVKEMILDLQQRIVSSLQGVGKTFDWDRLPPERKREVLRLRKAMLLWDEGKYDEAERLTSLLKKETMPEKDTPLWAPVSAETAAEPAAETGEEAPGQTAEPSMPISEAADQVLAAPPDTETESAADTSIPASDTSGTVTDTSTPHDRVKTTIRGQLEAIAAQGGEQAQVLGSEEIDAYSTLFAAMAEQAGNRQGISAEEWLQSQNLKIVNGRPQFEASSEGTKLDQPLNEGVDPESTMTGFVAQPRFTAEQALELRSGKRRVEFIRSVSGKYQNEDTGWNINLSNKNVSHAIASAVKNNEVDLATSMNILAELPKIIQNARLVESHEDQKQKGYVDKIHRFFVPSKISNDPKAMYKVKLTVKELAGHFETSIEGIYRAYDTRIIEKVSERRHRKGLKDQPLNSHTPDTFEIILGPFLEGVKDSDGKLYLSDNGETRSQSTAAVDSEYLSAVEAGDMDTSQRMVDEAAREAGFVVQHVFHGSKRIDRLGNELKPERATSGPMPFFTDDPTIADNYSQNKADTSIEIPESYNGWFKVDIGRGKPKTIDQAWLRLSLGKRRELAQKLPHIVNTDQEGGNDGEFVLSPDRYGMADKSHWDHVIREKRGNVLEAAVEIWLDSGELYDQEEKFLEILRVAGLEGVVYDSPWLELPGVVEAHLAIRTPFDTSDISDDDFAVLEAASKGKRGSTNIADEWDKRRFSGKEWIALLEQDRKDGTSFAWTSIPDWVSRELQRMGYDGIKDQGGKYTGEGHTVWIPFFPWQVKRADAITRDDQGNVIPLSQRFDTAAKDIRFQDAAGSDSAPSTSARGSILFSEKGTRIRLNESMDRSTMLHEFGHLFLRDLEVNARGGDASSARDFGILKEWWKKDASWLASWIRNSTSATVPEGVRVRFAGAKGADLVRSALDGAADQEAIMAAGIAAEEMFARGFERYLSEGSAPSSALKQVFERFKVWLSEVYEKMAGNPNFRLSKEARDVMARMVGGEGLVDGARNAVSVRENLGIGLRAMKTVIERHEDVPDAMSREDLGSVSFVWGTPGKGKGFKGGYGVSHIIARRNAEGNDGEKIARKMVEVIAKGKVVRRYGPEGAERADVAYDGHTAVLSLYSFDEKKTWLLSGWKDYGDVKSSGAREEGFDSSGATHHGPTHTRPMMGAEDYENIIPSSEPEDNISESGEVRISSPEKEYFQSSNKKIKQQQALTHKAKETEQARRMNNAPETLWLDEGSPISEQDIEEVFGTRSRAAKETETPWPGEGENVTEADIDEIFSEGSWSVEGFSSAVQAIDDFFTPEKKHRGGEKGPNAPKNRERYDKEGNLLSENTKEVSYLNPIYTLTSPSLLAKKNKLFAPFFKMAKEAQELQETLRRDFNAVLDKAWGSLSDDQSQALNEILIEGDLRGRTFTDEQLTARGLDEDVRRGYMLIRDLSDRVGKAVRQRQRDSGTKVMGWREGYVPHIFHGFFIRLDGRIVDTARSLQEAVELARNVEKDHPGGIVDIVSKPNDFSGSSAYNASALNDRKLLKFSTTMEEAFAFTPDEAERFLKGYDKKAFKNRIFAFSHERLGVKGWDQDMKFAFRHYVNQSARFLAMDELKYKGIGLFEKTWGNFNHEYSQLADYTKKYLNDVLGVPSNASRMMNDLFKRNPTMYKISKQVFGDRPAEYLASVFTKGMGVAKLGFLNIASAMMNLSQLINASALLGYSDLGLGIRQYFANLTKPSERVTRIYEETGVLDNLNVAAGAGYSKASEKMYGIIGRFLELSMAPFAYMDGMCRKATVLAAYNKAHREGKSHTEAIAYAKEINDRANFDYSVADTPAFLRRSGPLGQVIFQFKKFGIKQLELATGLNGFAQNARFWIPMIALSGLWGFPGAELLKALFMALFDRDPQAELNAWMAKNSSWIPEPVRRTIQYGLLSNAGVDISKRVGMGDVIPNELADLLGPTVGTIHRMSPHVATLAGKLFGLEGDGTAALLNALEALSPGLSNPIKAILGEVEDKKRGRLKFRYQGLGERAVRAMGFRPTREAVESDAVRTANYVEAKRMEREREAIDEYVRARESGSTKDAAKTLARLKELKVTPDRIIRELRERKKGTAYERLQQKLKGQKSQEARKVLQGF